MALVGVFFFIETRGTGIRFIDFVNSRSYRPHLELSFAAFSLVSPGFMGLF